MATMAIDLFYSYAPQDEQLCNKLNTHLALLRQQGIIREWYSRDIRPGSARQQEIDRHLQAARIILLLISPDFIASDYCYGNEMQIAMSRYNAGEAVVLPILLRPCDWESAPFGKLRPLPQNAKPVTRWTSRDAAFTEIVKGIRDAVEAINAKRSFTSDTAEKVGEREPVIDKSHQLAVNSARTTNLASPVTLGTSALKPAINRYYKSLRELAGIADHEQALRHAFQNLLSDVARMVNWTFIAEQTLEGNIRPDGVLRDNYFMRGCWEAKGPKSNLEQEIQKKVASGYPLINTIFENTKQAVLFQSKKRANKYNLENPDDVAYLLRDFFSYTEPDIANFETAVQEFKGKIPDLAKNILEKIELEHKQNKRFIAAFDSFTSLCRTSLNPNITIAEINEMLVQHLLTERLLRTVFNNSDFVNQNVIAVEIEKVIRVLASRVFNRGEFLKSLDRFYIAIESAARGIDSWSERQHFLNTVYESFFQGFAVRKADTHGIVYTPQEIVDFMCNSVEEVLKTEFGKTISQPGVQLLDPATGTGNFIVNLIRNHINRRDLKYKYKHDLFCNEIMLLPYYIASLNIEHEYYEKMGEYEPFEGICFADTLELAESQQRSLFVEENTERVRREKEAEIMVVIGNPPYNVGQKSENDNNRNRVYSVLDKRIHDTYVKSSRATNTRAVSDVYVKFFRWATERLGDRDGIVCLVTNNSFLDQIAFDGMRKHLQNDFTQIYHLDLHGNVRKNPKISGTIHNVFGIQLGVGITIAIRSSQHQGNRIHYHRLPEHWNRIEKLAFLSDKKNISSIDWLELQADAKYTWITEGIHPEFSEFFPLGTRNIKAMDNFYASEYQGGSLFKTFSSGVQTNRDSWMYDFSVDSLGSKASNMIENYNAELSRWIRAGSPKNIDDFVTPDEAKIKWSSRLKECFARKIEATFDPISIRHALYRPFTRQFLYYDSVMTHRQGQFSLFFPTLQSELENKVVCVTGIGADHQTFFAANTMVDVKCGISGNSTVQCFPFYTYAEDGTNRRENITDWALGQFREKYGEQVTKWDIFHYVYGMLHHPQYRERYAENLKRDLPHIPLLFTGQAFEACVRIGKLLMDLHLNYEQAQEYPSLEWFENKDVPFSWRVEKMRLSTDKRVAVVNESLRVGPIPEACFQYRLGNRSALEWVIDQYQVSTDKRSGIVSDPNNPDDEEYIVRLVCKVVTVSVETVRLVNELAHAVTAADWLNTTSDEKM